MSECISDLADELKHATAQLLAAAEYVKSPFFSAQIGESLALAHIRAKSPWANRLEAAEYAGEVGVAALDQAANDGLIRRYQIGGRTVFKKSEIDEAIESGKWPKHKRKAA